MLISDSQAPTYKQLRPCKSVSTSTFPVYPNLASTLVEVQEHPDKTAAHAMAACAGYAYSTADTVTMIMARMGLENNRCRMIAQDVDAMFICSTAFLVQSECGRVVILAYRGTEPMNVINWLTDLDIYPEKVVLPFAGATEAFEVHGGFYRNLRATRHEVIDALKRALEGKPVSGKGADLPNGMEALYVTGHSLGAAMAAMLAVTLVNEPAYAKIAEKLRAVYSFAQPMIGSPELAEFCEADPFLAANVIRYIYGRDVVPHFPPNDSGDFAHFGPEYHYGGGWPWTLRDRPSQQMGTFVGVLEAGASFFARQNRLLRHLPFSYSLSDHGPQHYISALTPPGVPTEFGGDAIPARAAVAAENGGPRRDGAVRVAG